MLDRHLMKFGLMIDSDIRKELMFLRYIWDFRITCIFDFFFLKNFFTHLKDLVKKVTEIGVRGLKT